MKSSPRTRQSLLTMLKQYGPSEAAMLAARLKLSAMAVRQHLYTMADEQFVTYQDERRPRGRPARVWRLTAAANKVFPDAHALLSVRLIEAIQQSFGEAGIDKLIAARTKQQLAEYENA